jgi:hypothetical protein
MGSKYRQFYLAKKRKSAREVMHDFLIDCLQRNGRVEINESRQAGTFARAIKEGYITQRGELLPKAKEFYEHQNEN